MAIPLVFLLLLTSTHADDTCVDDTCAVKGDALLQHSSKVQPLTMTQAEDASWSMVVSCAARDSAKEKVLTMKPATSDQIQEFVDEHNKYRCMHGAPPVVWDAAVAADGEQFIDGQTTMHHSDCYNVPPPAGPAGENLYMSSGSATPSAAVAAWYSEVNDCPGGPTAFTNGCKSDGKPTGHFTAMIWKGVKSIGCAFSASTSPTLVVCRYKAGDSLSVDTPNMQGAYTSQVFPRTKEESQCGSGSSGGASPSPAATPSPPTPPPPPLPASSDGCVSLNGCKMTFACPSSTVSIKFACKLKDLGMTGLMSATRPGSSTDDFSAQCSECSDLEIWSGGR